METERRNIQAGYNLDGLCYSDGHLYTVERRKVESGRISYSLAVYQIESDSENITLMDRLELADVGSAMGYHVCPRVERHSQWVFVPCSVRLAGYTGVTVAHLDHDRLVRERTLTCVRDAVSVDVMSPDTVYVCVTYNVHVVDVRQDKITSTLDPVDIMMFKRPNSVAVLGNSVIVGYIDQGPLVVYRHGNPAPFRVIQPPDGMRGLLPTISTDCERHYILIYMLTKFFFVMDIDGNLRHTAIIDTQTWTRDCTVVNRQLWVGCHNGEIVIMSSQ